MLSGVLFGKYIYIYGRPTCPFHAILRRRARIEKEQRQLRTLEKNTCFLVKLIATEHTTSTHHAWFSLGNPLISGQWEGWWNIIIIWPSELNFANWNCKDLRRCCHLARERGREAGATSDRKRKQTAEWHIIWHGRTKQCKCRLIVVDFLFEKCIVWVGVM